MTKKIAFVAALALLLAGCASTSYHTVMPISSDKLAELKKLNVTECDGLLVGEHSCLTSDNKRVEFWLYEDDLSVVDIGLLRTQMPAIDALCGKDTSKACLPKLQASWKNLPVCDDLRKNAPCKFESSWYAAKNVFYFYE